MNATPDGLLTLSSGSHSPGGGKACVMEYVALLAGEPWTDTPTCTHPVLAATAQRVNDALPDSERHRLIPMIGRLFGTEPPTDALEAKRLSVGLAIWSTEQVLHLVQAEDRKVCEDALSAARAWVNDPSEQNANAAANAAIAANDAANAAVDVNAAYATVKAASNAAYAAVKVASNVANAYAAVKVAYNTASAIAATHADDYSADSADYSADSAAYAAYAASARVELLSGLIDEYDRLTGRTEHRDVTKADLAYLRRALDGANGGDRDE